MSLASNSPHPPLPHTPPLFFRSFPPPPLPRLKAGRCPAGPQIRSSGFLHPDRSLLLASLPSLAFPAPPSLARALLPGRRPYHPAEHSPQVGDTVATALQVQTRARGPKEPPAGAAASAPGSLLRAGLRGTRGARRGQLPRAICLLPFPEILAAFVLRLQGACSKGERKSVPPVIKRQPQRAGRFRDSGSCVHLTASFASQREEPSLLVSGLGECQVWFLRRRTYYRWRQFL